MRTHNIDGQIVAFTADEEAAADAADAVFNSEAEVNKRFNAKVDRIEELDASIPKIMALNPTVMIVTGDHSTPCFLRAHSWHPVPTLLVSDCCRPDQAQAFNETTCIGGGLGQFEARHLMTLALANADRLGKYGA